MSRFARTPVALVAVVAVVAVLALAGCSSSDESADATTTTVPSTCDAVQGVADSVANLISSDTLGGGRDTIEAALSDVESSVQELGDVAGDALSSDVDTLTQALDDLQSAVSDLGGDASAADTVSALTDSITAVVQAVDSLVVSAGNELADCSISPLTSEEACAADWASCGATLSSAARPAGVSSIEPEP